MVLKKTPSKIYIFQRKICVRLSTIWLFFAQGSYVLTCKTFNINVAETCAGIIFFSAKFAFVWVPYDFFSRKEVTFWLAKRSTLMSLKLVQELYQNSIVAVLIFADEQFQTLRWYSSSMGVKRYEIFGSKTYIKRRRKYTNRSILRKGRDAINNANALL